MKKIILVLIPLFTILIPYFVGAFVKLDFNVANWGEDARIPTAIFSVITLIVGIMVSTFIYDHQKEK